MAVTPLGARVGIGMKGGRHILGSCVPWWISTRLLVPDATPLKMTDMKMLDTIDTSRDMRKITWGSQEVFSGDGIRLDDERNMTMVFIILS